jgi:hypothetical protein
VAPWAAAGRVRGDDSGGVRQRRGRGVLQRAQLLRVPRVRAGASSGTIQTMLRWRSDDALRILGLAASGSASTGAPPLCSFFLFLLFLCFLCFLLCFLCNRHTL